MKQSFRFFTSMLFFLCCISSVKEASGNPEILDSASLFKKISPAVVLLIGENSIGSGSIVSETDILTNWHVVGQNKRLLIAFKPREEGAAINTDDLVVGDVVRKAPDKDLALVRVKRLPPGVTPIQLGSMSEVEIGADVHAIGHPQGESWTYTKGVISQIRSGFQWQAGPLMRFKADVIQTQTPINPGNSGGPLLSSRGHLVGVNAFKARGSEGLNFAVSLSEVSIFLENSATSRLAPSHKTQNLPEAKRKMPKRQSENSRAAESNTSNSPKRRPQLAYQGRDKTGAGYMRVYIPSGGGVESTYFYPDDPSKPFYCFKKTDGLTEAVILDMNRNGKWNYSILDRDRNGKFETIGVHPDGKMKPSSFLPLRNKKVPAEVKAAMPRQVPEPGPENASSPSFDCTRADTLIQRTICGSERLADLDVTVSALYSRVTQKRSAMKAQITAGQKEWIRGTESLCGGENIVDCLEDRYKQRVIYLNVLMLSNL